MQKLRETDFLAIPSFPDYEVNAFGSVRRIGKLAPLKPGTMKNGYMVVTMRHMKQTKTKLVHRLVAETWIGPIPAGYDVCHNDGSRTNNVVTNLRFGTRKENMRDTIAHGTTNRGERCGGNKYPESLILEIRQRHQNGDKARKLSIDFNIPLSTIWGIVRRINWRWL